MALTEDAFARSASRAERAEREARGRGQQQPPLALGAVPALALACALGLLIEVLAAQAGRDSAWWGDPAFWAGLLVIFVPIFFRLTQRSTARQERVVLLALLGLALYLVKVVQYPLYFGQPDEYQHWRTAQDIAQTSHLFQANSLLLVSPLFPGLEIVTNAVQRLVGTSTFVSALIVVGVARLLLMLMLFVFFERIIGSHRLAAIGAMLYLANPLFILFDAQYGYESLAMPIAVGVLFVVVARGQAERARRLGWTVCLWLALGALTVTHHLTAYALAAFLLVWVVVYLVSRRLFSAQGASPILAFLASIELNIAWLVIAGDLVIGYLAPDLISAVKGILGIISGEAVPRQLFHDHAGDVAPSWERYVSMGAVVLLTVGIAVGLLLIWRRFRMNSMVLVLGVVALAYPASQLFRFTANGAEIATRPLDFFFIAVAFVVGVALSQLWSAQWTWHPLLWKGLALAALLVILAGGAVTGTAPNWERLPGPYVVEGDGRAFGPANISAATWAQAHLGPGNLVGTDRDDAFLMATFGRQLVAANQQNTNLMPVYFATSVSSYELSLLRQTPIRYIVIDTRLSTALPATGTYYEPGGDSPIETPISPLALSKYDSVPGVGRVYDNGNLIIYDFGLLNGSGNG